MDNNLRDIPFTKMTGSGNDFVFFDGRYVPLARVSTPEVIRSICNRRNGVGGDGLVVLEPVSASPGGDPFLEMQARIHYFNSDGTPADLCGNATLCSTALAAALGIAPADGMGLETPSGRIASRLTDGLPEIALPEVHAINPTAAIDLESGEQRAGFLIVGIPHLVILCEDAEAVEMPARGPMLRRHAAGGPTGANVNWVSPLADGSWRYRTFERGVEGETLACGTGAVACAILLAVWGLSGLTARLMTSSGRPLDVSLRRSTSGWLPALRGEGRVVFHGRINELDD